jgi:hypothetical protein
VAIRNAESIRERFSTGELASTYSLDLDASQLKIASNNSGNAAGT